MIYFRYGLGSMLTISCFHCGRYNHVATGKRHKVDENFKGQPVCWDVNTKVAIGNFSII